MLVFYVQLWLQGHYLRKSFFPLFYFPHITQIQSVLLWCPCLFLCCLLSCYKYNSISDYDVIIFVFFLLLFLHPVLPSQFGRSCLYIFINISLYYHKLKVVLETVSPVCFLIFSFLLVVSDLAPQGQHWKSYLKESPKKCPF